MGGDSEFFLRCLLLVLCILMDSLMPIVHTALTVEIRVDKVNALEFRPSGTAATTCCFTAQCACSTRIQACLFDHVIGSCPDRELQTGPDMGQCGLAVGRTPSLLYLSTKPDQDEQNLGLRVVLIYGSDSKQGSQSLLGHYRLDLKGLPLGPNSDEVGWSNFGLGTEEGVKATLQVKVYCGTDYYGEVCSRRCVPRPGQYFCHQDGQRSCLGLWTGSNCDVLDPCLSYPCLNAGTCHPNQKTGFTCQCHPKYTGTYCSMGLDSCASIPCHHTATCIDLVEGFRCVCPADRTGLYCQTDIDDCRNDGCQNNGKCQLDPSLRSFRCLCPRGYYGNNCHVSVCHVANCENGGTCLITGNNSFRCQCASGYTGNRCQNSASSCSANPCQNGGRCVVDKLGHSKCVCKGRDYKGNRCEFRNPCASNPCGDRGICHSLPSSEDFRCECLPSFIGRLCAVKDPCYENPCLNDGVCSRVFNSNDSHGSNGGYFEFTCICRDKYFGKLCEIADMCLSKPCLNGGVCKSRKKGERSLTFECECRDGFVGSTCDTHDMCGSSSGPCKNNGSCVASNSRGQGYLCQCAFGYTGEQCQTVSHCISNPCVNGGTCYESPSSSSYRCICRFGFSGHQCELGQLVTSPCSLNANPCGSYGQCHACNAGNEICGSLNRNYKCICSGGYSGIHCDKRDPCYDSRETVCRNGGKCVPINDTYTCLCPSGVKSRDCSGVGLASPCLSNPCLNNGVCTHTRRRIYSQFRHQKDPSSYVCTCPPGLTGKHCDLINNCFVSPCLNQGTCVSRTTGNRVDVRCKCVQGYTGDRCERKPSCPDVPCRNNGKCVVKYGSKGRGNAYSYQSTTSVCFCATGFSGDFCERVSDCRDTPCLNNGVCRELSTSGMACECPSDFVGKRCETRIACKEVACLNGGVCKTFGAGENRNLIGYLYGFRNRYNNNYHYERHKIHPVFSSRCVCRPGFTGLRCELLVNVVTFGISDDDDDDGARSCVFNSCRNGGRCVQVVHRSKCECLRGWSGRYCHIWQGRRGLCRRNICSGRGVCYQGNDNKPACRCQQGFGQYCEHSCANHLMGRPFPHPTDCSQYVTCVWGTPYAMRCPGRGLHFNPRMGSCDWPMRAGCREGGGGVSGSGGARAMEFGGV